jgi:hypothetical protein
MKGAAMFTCPWCGTTYPIFQSSCSRCGGPLHAPAADVHAEAAAAPATPPPPPRPISDQYAWKLMSSDGWAIAALVFLILGAVFAPLGLILSIAIVTLFIGIPFLGMGILFLAAGFALGSRRLQEARNAVEVLRNGTPSTGEITLVEQNPNVRINNRNPWTVRYRYTLGGREYTGQVSTLNLPGPSLQPGHPVCVLYLPQFPERGVLYPHP